MKLLFIYIAAAIAAYVENPTNPSITSPPDAHITQIPVFPDSKTPLDHLNKRMNIQDYERQKKLLEDAYNKAVGVSGDTTTTTVPDKWIRTIYSTKVEIVQPTVIRGVTFSAKPPATTDGLEQWIDLDKNGSPKTKRPKLKGGHTENASPTYDTWFATPTTIEYTKEELKAHNMEDDEIHKQVDWIPEDLTYHSLNPVIRCTPDRYKKKGLNKNLDTLPFCTPVDNSHWKKGLTYFVTWYSRHFDAEKVRFHLSEITPSLKDQGYRKRSAIMEKGGKITSASFYTSDWINNDDGIWPIEIVDDLFEDDKQLQRKVLLSIQPDTIDDEEFDLLKNSLVIEIFRTYGKVKKGKSHQDLELLELKQKLKHLGVEIEDGFNYEKYFAIMGIPLFVVALGCGMYIFVMVNKTDLSHLKRKKARGTDHHHRRIPYKSIPMHNIPSKQLGKHE